MSAPTAKAAVLSSTESVSERSYLEVLPLASGGMGSVSVCVLSGEEGFERVYAMKRIHPRLAMDEDFLDMFLREARIAGAIRHVNVVGVLDVQRDEEGPFLIMEFVEGMSLSTVLRSLRADVPLQVTLRILRDVWAGLAAAHSACDSEGRPLGIIHRDVSPGNVLIGFDGVSRLTDFGIAKAASASTHTAAGIFKGKVGYAAPEMLLFQTVDFRADFFAFGVVMFEAITGLRLYGGEGGPSRLLNDPPPDLLDHVDVPDAIANLLFRLLAKSPSDRPSDASEVLRLLDDAIADMAAVEGRLGVGEYLRETFADQRQARRDTLEAAFAKAREPAVEEAPASVAPSPRRRYVVPLGVAALAGLAALLYVQRAQPSPSPTTPTDAVDSRPPDTQERGADNATETTMDAGTDTGPASAEAVIEPTEMQPSRRRRRQSMRRVGERRVVGFDD